MDFVIIPTLLKSDTEDDFFASRSLDVFVTRLRKLFADDERIQIKTVKGVGLCLSDKG